MKALTYQAAKKYFVQRGHTVTLTDRVTYTVLLDGERWSLPAFLTMAQDTINA